ncbi:MAG: UDP-2,3-diacylglucosamine diphosphatase [Halioglobus sp.]|nr:UDP-2,3-diacylglucosamine diphosphatase [Halioglobus sp.]
MSSTYFISDLHLDASRPATEQAFYKFLDRIAVCDALYILGDLFESWLGDDDDAALGERVCQALADFTDGGPRLFVMHGNRDYLLGLHFCARTGAMLIPDPHVIELFGIPTLLMHGDSLCTDDATYQAFRAKSRESSWQTKILSETLEERREIAARLREMSNEARSNKPEDIVDVSPREVNRVMKETQVMQLIHGHTHRPGRHDEDYGTRWVLGDWDRYAWCVEASDGSFDLRRFRI